MIDARESPTGSVRINTSKGGLRLLMRDLIPRFLHEFPEVQLDIGTEGRLVDIVKEGFDAGIRLRDAVPVDMIAVPVRRDLRFVAVASPAYLQKAGTPEEPEDLDRHRCIRQRLPSGKRYAWEFMRHGEEFRIDPSGPLTLDDNDAMAQAAEKGFGIAYLPETYVEEALAAGRLVAVLSKWGAAASDLVLYFPAGRHLPKALRAFIDTARSRSGGSAYEWEPAS